MGYSFFLFALSIYLAAEAVFFFTQFSQKPIIILPFFRPSCNGKVRKKRAVPARVG
jgi:hypothetical protein